MASMAAAQASEATAEAERHRVVAHELNLLKEDSTRTEAEVSMMRGGIREAGEQLRAVESKLLIAEQAAEQAEQRCGGLNGEVTELKQLMSEMDQTRTELSERYQMVLSQLEQKCEALRKAERARDESEAASSKWQEEALQAKAQLTSLDKAYDQAQEELDSHSLKNEESVTQLRAASEAADAAHERQGQAQQQCEELLTIISGLELESQKLRRQIELEGEARKAVEEEVDARVHNADCLKQDLSTMTRESQLLGGQLHSSGLENQQLTRQLQESESQICRLHESE